MYVLISQNPGSIVHLGWSILCPWHCPVSASGLRPPLQWPPTDLWSPSSSNPLEFGGTPAIGPPEPEIWVSHRPIFSDKEAGARVLTPKIVAELFVYWLSIRLGTFQILAHHFPVCIKMTATIFCMKLQEIERLSHGTLSAILAIWRFPVPDTLRIMFQQMSRVKH
jgi:hypothetical protein